MKLASLLVVMMLGGVAHADHAPRPPKGQLRQLLLQHFDRNHDGQLGPRERWRAARALHRLANRLGRASARQAANAHHAPHARNAPNARQHRKRTFIRRFDLNRDGNIGPGEMPPAIADELRPLDRDGNGWLQGSELP